MKTLETIDLGNLDTVTGGADKLFDKTLGAVSGATVGAYAGLICGPGAWVCSPVGAAIGAFTGAKLAKDKM
jgi:outer membrane lipoprotein SlyB